MSRKDGSMLPGNNFVRDSKVRRSIFQEFAPALTMDNFLMDQINRYVFRSLKQAAREAIRVKIKKHIIKRKKEITVEDLDILMTTIDGMFYAAINHQLFDNNALDNWLDIKKQEVLIRGIYYPDLNQETKDKMAKLNVSAKENGG